MTLDNYPAPLDKLPLFVKAGAIIPQWPPMLYYDEKPHDPMTLELYPEGNSSFSLYEDDGVTRQYQQNKYAKTLITMSGTANYTDRKPAETSLRVSAMQGLGFTGQLKSRVWMLKVHAHTEPFSIVVNNGTDTITIPKMKSVPSVDYNPIGWFYNRLGLGNKAVKAYVYIKLPNMSTSVDFTVTISAGAHA
jgi:alpha-glucosidase